MILRLNASVPSARRLGQQTNASCRYEDFPNCCGNARRGLRFRSLFRESLLDLADEIRYSILPILIGEGIPFFDKLSRDVALHLAEVKAYKSGIVELRYDVRASRG